MNKTNEAGDTHAGDEIRGRRIKTRTANNAAYKVLSHAKDLLHQVRFRSRTHPPAIVFIVGCQRSGTTMLNDVFKHDLRSKVYGEVSELTNADPIRQLRLNPWDDVLSTIAKSPAPISVVKPLVESQNTSELLSFFPNSCAVWMVRHYRPVAASCVSKWGAANSIRDLRDVVFSDSSNWRSQNLSQQTKDTVAAHFREDMDGHDAAALFWYTRNIHWVEAGYGEDDRVLLCHYDDLVSNGPETLRKIYALAGQPYPGDRIGFRMHDKSTGSKREVELSQPVEDLCAELWSELRT